MKVLANHCYPYEEPKAMLPDELFFCLACFQDCFTAPSFQRFLTLLTGWILCTSKHTITGVMRAAGVVGKREHGGYHRFFNTAAWSADEVGIVVMRLVLTMLPEKKKVKLTIDDTLARHKGRHVAVDLSSVVTCDMYPTAAAMWQRMPSCTPETVAKPTRRPPTQRA